jgi:hypothetical protein
MISNIALQKLIKSIIVEHKKILLAEGKSSYILPSDGTHIFWDFYTLYTLWYLYGSGHTAYYPKDEFNPTTGPSNYVLRDYIDNVFESCLFQLSNKMANYLKKIIIMEFRYAFGDEGGFYDTYYKIKKRIKNKHSDYHSMPLDKFLELIHSNDSNNIPKELFDKMVKLSFYSVKENIAFNTDSDSNEDDSRSRFVKLFEPLIKKAGITLDDIEIYFRKADWESDYGGDSWGEIVKVYKELIDKMENAEAKDLVVIIDKIYDMEHNTGSVLNKGDLLISKSDLDLRANFADLSDFATMSISSNVKKIVDTILKKSPDQRKYYSGHNYGSGDIFLNDIDKKILRTYGFTDNSWEKNRWDSPVYNKDGWNVTDELSFRPNRNNVYSSEFQAYIPIPLLFKHLYKKYPNKQEEVKNILDSTPQS